MYVGVYLGAFLRRYDVNVLDWVSKSPDRNPIEHLWDELDKRVRRLQIPQRNLVEHEQVLVRKYSAIDQAYIRPYS